MVGTQLARLRDTDSRWIGLALLLIGVGWIGLQPLAMELSGAIGHRLSVVAFGSAGIGAIHLVVGLYVLGTERFDRSASFAESLLIGVVALLVSSGVVIYWEFLQSGVVRLELLLSFPVFACYVATWGFPLGVATTRRQRVAVVGALCAVPVAILLLLAVLILTGGGWGAVILLASLPVVAALIPLMLLLAAPLVAAGWSVRAPRPANAT